MTGLLLHSNTARQPQGPWIIVLIHILPTSLNMKTWLTTFQSDFFVQESLQIRYLPPYPTLSILKHFFVVLVKRKNNSMLQSLILESYHYFPQNWVCHAFLYFSSQQKKKKKETDLVNIVVYCKIRDRSRKRSHLIGPSVDSATKGETILPMELLHVLYLLITRKNERSISPLNSSLPPPLKILGMSSALSDD